MHLDTKNTKKNMKNTEIQIPTMCVSKIKKRLIQKHLINKTQNTEIQNLCKPKIQNAVNKKKTG